MNESEEREVRTMYAITRKMPEVLNISWSYTRRLLTVGKSVCDISAMDRSEGGCSKPSERIVAYWKR